MQNISLIFIFVSMIKYVLALLIGQVCAEFSWQNSTVIKDPTYETGLSLDKEYMYVDVYLEQSVSVSKRVQNSQTYEHYTTFKFNNDTENFFAFQLTSISRTGKYIAGQKKSTDSMYVFQHNVDQKQYDFIGVVTAKEGKFYGVRCAKFDPLVEENLVICADDKIEVRKVTDASTVQVFTGRAYSQAGLIFSDSGRFLLTNGDLQLGRAFLYGRDDNNTQKFLHMQNLSTDEHETYALAISRDEQEIAIFCKFSFFYYYRYDESAEEYVEVSESYMYASDEDQAQIQFSNDASLLVLQDDRLYRIYRRIGDVFNDTQLLKPYDRSGKEYVTVGFMILDNGDMITITSYNTTWYNYCTTPFCANCTENKSEPCLDCTEQHYLLNQSCIGCKGYPNLCLSCSSEDYCDSCEKGYTPYQGQCNSCYLKHCKVCNNMSLCIQCDDGYDFDEDRQCVESSSGGSVGAIIGGVIGGLVVVGGVVGFFVFYRLKKKKKMSILESQETDD